MCEHRLRVHRRRGCGRARWRAAAAGALPCAARTRTRSSALDVPVGAPTLGRKRDHARDPEILDAALEVLAETGCDGMTVDMVAARAKAGKATLYRRWSSKGELVIDAVACNPELADAAYAATVEPRASVNRLLLRRAIDRGEIPADTDVEALGLVSQAMVMHRVLILRKPVDREFLLSIVDGIVMPAVGLKKG